jgi:hypothetical protein
MKVRYRVSLAAAAAPRFVADSLLEEAVSSELVSEPKFPASWESTGNFIDFELSRSKSTDQGTLGKGDLHPTAIGTRGGARRFETGVTF